MTGGGRAKKRNGTAVLAAKLVICTDLGRNVSREDWGAGAMTGFGDESGTSARDDHDLLARRRQEAEVRLARSRARDARRALAGFVVLAALLSVGIMVLPVLRRPPRRNACRRPSWRPSSLPSRALPKCASAPAPSATRSSSRTTPASSLTTGSRAATALTRTPSCPRRPPARWRSAKDSKDGNGRSVARRRHSD